MTLSLPPLFGLPSAKPLFDAFELARKNHLKFPKIVLHTEPRSDEPSPGGSRLSPLYIRLTPSGAARASKGLPPAIWTTISALSPIPSELPQSPLFLGGIHPRPEAGGLAPSFILRGHATTFKPSDDLLNLKAFRAHLPPLLRILTLACTAPLETASRQGRLHGHCQFCFNPLSDDLSLDRGYGPTCAKKWGLPWGEVSLPRAAVLRKLQAQLSADEDPEISALFEKAD